MTCDVNTTTPAGRKRLRGVVRACRDFGQRVQFSVFEIELDPGQWVSLKARLESLIDPTARGTIISAPTGGGASSMWARSPRPISGGR